MARLKQNTSTVPINISFSGGLNLSAAEWSIADNESPRILNWVYNPESLLPEVRPGTSCQTASAAGSAIRALYLYEKSTTVKYIIGVYGTKLYYLSGATLNAWTEIGSIASATVVPEFLTVNTKLLIADGGTNIKTWDGTTYGVIASSPDASCLRLIKQRVACNHTGEPDSIYLSKPNDETVWDTTTTAIGLKAGFGDNLAVKGLEVFGDDLIICKRGYAKKRMYRLNTADTTTTNWYVKEVPGNSCSQTERAICAAFNNVFFFDDDGLRSLKGVTEYGDIQSDQTGRKINSYFDTVLTCNFLKYIPNYNAIWLSVGNRVFTGRMLNDELSCTELAFEQGPITSLCIDGTTIYLGGSNGYLYKINTTVATDETAPSTTSSYATIISSKRFNAGANDITLKNLSVRYTPITAGTFTVSVIKEDGTPVLLETVTIAAEGEYLYDADDYLYDADDYLYDSGTGPAMVVNRDSVKSQSLRFEIQSTGVRFSIDAILASGVLSKGSY